MGIGLLNAIGTVLMTIAFLGVCVWAYSSHRVQANQEAAQLPFADETKHHLSGVAQDGDTAEKAQEHV